FIATWLGVPVSTTHTITGAIVGVGAARRVSAVRWNVASSIVYAWVITIPASAGVAALAYWSVRLLRSSTAPREALPRRHSYMRSSRSSLIRPGFPAKRTPHVRPRHH